MHEQTEACLRAVQARDPRFDGWFYVGVRTTKIYCRPSCPAMTPKTVNMTFHPSAAAAQQAGYRACKRCRPDASPGSPEWDVRADVVARAVRLISDGILDRGGVPALAAALGYSVRQVQRLVHEELGAGPLAIARASRAQTARLLIETTDLPMTDVATAAGFASIRAFNTTVSEVFACSPTQLREAASGRRARGGASTRVGRGHGDGRTPPAGSPGHAHPGGAVELGCGPSGAVDGPGGAIDVRLAFRRPLDPSNLFGHLAATAVPGVEEWRDGTYRRTLRLPHGAGIVALRPPAPDERHVATRLWLADLRDLGPAIARCRRMLDLDADPHAVADVLEEDPALQAEVAKAPGRRVPRSADGPEFAVRAVLGQQVSTAAARTHAGRLVLAYGEPIGDPAGGLTYLFPTPEALLGAPPSLAMPASRRATLAGLLHALTEGGLDLGPGADPAEARAALGALPGIGPWTVEVVAMRALGDPDAFPATDLGVRQAAIALGLPDRPAALLARSAAWSPWRSYAVQYLWATGTHPVNLLPAEAV
ncbi:MAG: AlkA N-terminal domain-containing protein [Sporichthyaceae bacterium]